MTVPPVSAPTPDGQRDAQGREARYVLDRDGDLWVTAGALSWKCLTTDSCLVAGADLVNVCGPLVEMRPVHEVRAETLAEAFEAVSDRLGVAGDQTARMITLGALKAVQAR